MSKFTKQIEFCVVVIVALFLILVFVVYRRKKSTLRWKYLESEGIFAKAFVHLVIQKLEISAEKSESGWYNTVEICNDSKNDGAGMVKT